MDKKYKICFLGYGQLYDIAQEAIDSLEYKDVEIVLMECNVETLPKVVEQARSEGCEAFIAGAANAAEFARCSYARLVEIRLGPTDYLLAIKKAIQIGTRPVIAAYRFGRPINLELLEELSSVKLESVLYEDSAELQEGILGTDGDVIIGASHANEIAAELGRKSVLLYPGINSIRSAIQRARGLCIELDREIQKSKTSQAIINYAPFGLIVTDEYGRITVFNRMARKQIDLGEMKVQGRFLADIIPELSPEEFISSGQRQLDRRRLINETMIRCIQTRIEHNQRLIGILTTLYPDNTRRKKQDELTVTSFTAHASWKDVIGKSKAVQGFVQQAMAAGETDYPLIMWGEAGTGKNFFAQCIHNGSSRAKEPYVTVNAAILPDQDVARVLFGSEDSGGIHPGLLELAGNGTMVLQNLPDASRIVQDCLLQAMSEKKFLRLGGSVSVPFQAKVITILDNGTPTDSILEDLWLLLSVLPISVPPLRERDEDILSLFAFYATQESGLAHRRSISVPDELLRFYSWPGNLYELAAVCKRYAFLLSQGANQTPSARHLLMVQAIGEDKLFQEIIKRYPALADVGNSPQEDVLAGINAIKNILKYNNDKIAEKLSLSRTTLWRLKKGLGTDKK